MRRKTRSRDATDATRRGVLTRYWGLFMHIEEHRGDLRDAFPMVLRFCCYVLWRSALSSEGHCLPYFRELLCFLGRHR